MDEVLKDATNKINQFRDQLAKAKESAGTARALQKLKKQHEEERAEALREFADFKLRVSEREEKLERVRPSWTVIILK
jgi:hypothetical protein